MIIVQDSVLDSSCCFGPFLPSPKGCLGFPILSRIVYSLTKALAGWSVGSPKGVSGAVHECHDLQLVHHG